VQETDQKRRPKEEATKKFSTARETHSGGRLNTETNKTGGLNTERSKSGQLSPEESKRNSQLVERETRSSLNVERVKNDRLTAEANISSSLNTETNKSRRLIAEPHKGERQTKETNKSSKLNTETKNRGKQAEEQKFENDKHSRAKEMSDNQKFKRKSDHLKSPYQKQDPRGKEQDRTEQPKFRTNRAEQKPACVLTYSNKKVFKSSESIDELIDEKEDMKGKQYSSFSNKKKKDSKHIQ
jgi:hypothetical protein